MLLYAAKRIVLGIVILLIIVLALFSMIHVLPGDPVVVALGPHATLAMRAQFREQMGLDLPLPAQYLHYLQRLVRGDFGTDIWSGAPVGTLIMRVLPNTLILAGASMGWAFALGTLLGTIAALKRGRWPDWLGQSLFSGHRRSGVFPPISTVSGTASMAWLSRCWPGARHGACCQAPCFSEL